MRRQKKITFLRVSVRGNGRRSVRKNRSEAAFIARERGRRDEGRRVSRSGGHLEARENATSPTRAAADGADGANMMPCGAPPSPWTIPCYATFIGWRRNGVRQSQPSSARPWRRSWRPIGRDPEAWGNGASGHSDTARRAGDERPEPRAG